MAVQYIGTSRGHSNNLFLLKSTFNVEINNRKFIKLYYNYKSKTKIKKHLVKAVEGEK